MKPLPLLMCCVAALALLVALGVAAAAAVTGRVRYAVHRARAFRAAPPSDGPPVAALAAELAPVDLRAWTLRRYTAAGYSLASLPDHLRAALLKAHLSSAPALEDNGAHLQGRVLVASIAGTRLERDLEAHLRAALQAWTGASLTFANSYGPRTYTRGASLRPHCDRPETHALSAIVFVDAVNLDRPWPLQFAPNGARGHDPTVNVFLDAATDVLLYESTQPHARLDPLAGDSFTALFMHWTPLDW
jgi:hypothetical protein